ncbi:TrkA C-terminal domain-containing protein [Pyrobaculum neutrophilum]|uniref:TrkA-C domain protein n=1 Tax=Pyrobaculum neutrophilum (strain DSM 2338 / JCM 9278 / NBRC 100436 / V24Sta) TaxID=444157 RepID=B1YB66_PYRNV|nr:TrkA C-terminal domain-containing protein [Pyrobaculum neutrophilum]ACB39197.1 TrkA-C domain protein [Pyrobaculum neutrophilum V24Sta]
MVREAVVLDSNDDLGPLLARMLVDNGYVVRVLANQERAKMYEREAVYIHNLVENYERVLRGIDFSRVEVAVFPSPNDMLNLSFAKFARSQGVPIVVIVARGEAVAREAEELGIMAIVSYHCVLSRLTRILNLRFTRILPLKAGVAMLEMLVTSDSPLLGKTIGEVEEETGAKVAIVRGDEYLTSSDVEIQDGDYLIAVGPQADLQQLTK